MGRSRRVEDIALPLVSIGAPIPGLAYAPLFLLWFGLGNKSAVLLVAFVSAFPIVFNTWTGVKAVKEIWVRSAQAMGADDRRLFVKVIVPGALPYILTGLRLGLAQAWRILVGIEMLAAVPWGLGWMIFGAREFLNTDVMLAGVVVIGIIGLALEKLVFQKLEEYTVMRWGMMPMTAISDRTRSTLRATATIVVAALLYEAVARTGYFPPALMPTLPKVWNALVGSLMDGTMIVHAASTLYRVLVGLGLAVVIGLPLGILMARWKPIEHFFMPLVSALMPIPSLAWVPVFILWFGLGNTVRDPDRVLRRAVSDAAQHLVRRARGQSDLAPRRRRDGRQRARAVLEGDRAGRLAVHHHRIAAGVPARLDRGDRRGIPRRVRLRPRLGDLRRQGVPQRAADAGVADRDRHHRFCVRASGVRLDREGHRTALGHGADGQGVKT